MIKLGNNNIGKIYLGSNLIGKAYLGSNLVYQSGSGPSPSQNIPYIRNTVDAYIDTGITPDNTTKVIVWARNFNPMGGALFGSHIALNNSEFLLGSYGNTHIGEFRIDYGSTVTHVEGQFDKLSNYHKYELYQGVLKVDDVIVGTNTDTFNGNAHNIHLFGQNRNGSHIEMAAPADICACKIYKNNLLVRDYTATNSPSVGLYDAVSNTLFTNAGAGSLSYGTFDPDAYTPLDYITANKDAYFDSGVNGTYGMAIYIKFMPTNSTAQWTSIFGERVSDPAECCDLSLGTATSGQDNTKLYFRLGTTTTSQTISPASSMTNKEIVAAKENNVCTLYNNNTQIGTGTRSGVSTTFETTYPMAVGTIRTSSSEYSGSAFIGRLYYLRFGFDRNFIPAKVNNVAGMYDTYNDVFYASISGTNFGA